MSLKPIYHVEVTETTPSVEIYENTFKIVGRSLPENAIAFFQPILDQVKAHYDKAKPQKLTVDFYFEYYNTSSSKMIAKFLGYFKELSERGTEVNFIWKYYDGDDDMLDAGKEYEIVNGLKFEFVCLYD